MITSPFPHSEGGCVQFQHEFPGYALQFFLLWLLPRGDLRNQFGSVAQSCTNLCNPMDCSTPGFPVHHRLRSLLKLMSIKLVTPSNHLILCHPLLLLPSIFPSIRVISNESGGLSIGASASVLPMNIQDWFPLGLIGLISLQSKKLSRVFSNTTVQKHQFFGARLSL